jgi:seryl-tRNA synthetase
MDQVANIKKGSADSELRLEENQKNLNDLLSRIPNLIDESVPEGKDETGNKEIKVWGKKPEFKFKPKEHFELGEALGMLDFEAGAKLTGARFCVSKKQIARMERALINLMLDQHIAVGYEEILPPFIVNADTLYGTGQLPKFKEDLFRLDLPDRDWYLIPTAEVPVTNLKKNELFNRNELPLRYTAYTPCFRSEAGSYGRDTKGLIRQHQFNKVELVNIVAAEESNKAHEDMIARACSILELLNLPYRAMLLCAGDMGFGSRKTVDLEVWLPGQNTYREISSISNCWDFQARRAGIRFRGDEGKPEFAHTLNGSGLAVGRTLVAIMENYQQENGSIVIPEALRPYMGGAQLIQK